MGELIDSSDMNEVSESTEELDKTMQELNEMTTDPGTVIEGRTEVGQSEAIEKSLTELVNNAAVTDQENTIARSDSAEISIPVIEKELPEGGKILNKEIDKGLDGMVDDPTQSGPGDLGNPLGTGKTGKIGGSISTGGIGEDIGAGYGAGGWSDLGNASPVEKELTPGPPNKHGAVSEGGGPVTQGPTMVITVKKGESESNPVDGGTVRVVKQDDGSVRLVSLEEVLTNSLAMLNLEVFGDMGGPPTPESTIDPEDGGRQDKLPSSPDEMDKTQYDQDFISMQNPDSGEGRQPWDTSIDKGHEDDIKAATETRSEVSQADQKAGVEVITDPPEQGPGENPKGSEN